MTVHWLLLLVMSFRIMQVNFQWKQIKTYFYALWGTSQKATKSFSDDFKISNTVKPLKKPGHVEVPCNTDYQK